VDSPPQSLEETGVRMSANGRSPQWTFRRLSLCLFSVLLTTTLFRSDISGYMMQLCCPGELSGFVAHLFDKGVPTTCPSSVPTPFINDNPPPMLVILDFFKFISDPCSYESVLFIHQDLYPARPVDAEVSDSSHNGQGDTKGNDDGGQGAPSSEPTAPNPIGSGMAAQVRSSAADQLTTVAPLGSGPSNKKRLVLASKRKQPTPFDQVTTELFPHHAPHSSPGLVELKLVFGRLFEALQHHAQST
jgi:hypothetical protein